jgi:hypothetical protein
MKTIPAMMFDGELWVKADAFTAELSQNVRRPEAWITEEALASLTHHGGNGSRGTVPIHAEKSRVAKIAVYFGDAE